MLPTKRTDAHTPQSISDYQTLAARETALPPALGDFLELLGPRAKDRHGERQAALSAAIRHLQASPPERQSIQLWLLVSYAPALQALARRYSPHGTPPAETESTVVLAFLEVLQGMSTERLADAYLEKRIVDDARRRLMVLLGIRDYQQAEDIEFVENDVVQEDRAPDERVDGYEALLAQINDMPITDADRTLLISLYVYGYNMAELADQWQVPHETIKKRHQRLLGRLKKNL
ncbi:MAG: sigma-70 family RNA polymerase sigma factor [Candidatus Delongbacteria bacterium]